MKGAFHNVPAAKNEPFTSRLLSRRQVLKSGLYGGLAAALPTGILLGGCGRRQRRGGRPNIILITLDTTRADHLSCYGYPRQTSPNIDKLAGESLVYNRAIAPASWTLPSHASLFTGKFTSSHGARFDQTGPLRLTNAIKAPALWSLYRARGLSPNELTLAAILKKAGFATGAVVGGPWLKKIFGLNKGFDYYDDTQISNPEGRLARDVTAGAVRWIRKLRHKEFFLFLNYFDPHGPYKPREGFEDRFLPKGTKLEGIQPAGEQIKDVYDAEILYMDHYIGRLLKKLKSYNLYENSFIIVTADHGELLGEHGLFGHGKFLYQQELHIPLLLKYPGREVAPARTDCPVQLPDIFALILDRLGLEAPELIQGSCPPDTGHPVVAELYPLPVTSQNGDLRAIFEDDFKFYWNSKARHLLFNLKTDPAEEQNLLDKQPQIAEAMMQRLNSYIASLPKPCAIGPVQEVDQQTQDTLRSLGYVK